MENNRVKSYDDGLKEAWDIATRLLLDSDISSSTIRELFGEYEDACNILKNFTIHEVKAKLEHYDEVTKVLVGDIIEHIITGKRAVVTSIINKTSVYILMADGKSKVVLTEYWKKTGISIDKDMKFILNKLEG